MKTLILLTFLLLTSSFAVAQPAVRSSATATRFRSRNGLVKKTNKPSLHAGPKVKNPRAAGRAGYLEVVIETSRQRQLTGPRYKNRKRSHPSGYRRGKAATKPRKRLNGPRFKNRTTKRFRKTINAKL
ncbi:MAG: hypothetical protein ACI81P_003673 [Neolewinella sp.]|jgi:hypothetical protein